MIRRAGLERMCASYPCLRYKPDRSLDAAVESEKRFAFFESMIAGDGTYLSEDFAFCKAGAISAAKSGPILIPGSITWAR
jgi:hypothetical protein